MIADDYNESKDVKIHEKTFREIKDNTNINLNLEEQANEQVYGDDWTDTAQDKLESWKINAVENSALHEKARKKWTRFRDTLKLPSFGLTALAAFTMGINQFYEKQSLNVVALGLTSFDLFLKAVYYHYSPSERAEKHNEASNAYAGLCRSIDYQVYLPPNKRPDVEVAFVQVTTELDAIGSRAPPI